MKVNQVIENVDKNSGGTATYIQELSWALQRQNLDITISTLSTNSPLDFSDDVLLHFFDKRYTLKNGEVISDFDVFHINGLWKYFIHKMITLARENKVPYIISPHGMLEEWSLAQGKFKKRLALLLFQKNDLAKSACIHVTAYSEMQSVRGLGLKNPVAIIPNGIDLNKFKKEVYKNTSNKKTLLFLSRIHKKKGIEFLIDAWKKLEHPQKKNWKVKIIGNGSSTYITKLKQKILSNHLSESVEILPPIFEFDRKMEVFRKADAFVLPSHSENFGIVVAEALASFTPVITTKGTPWDILNYNNCGWWIEIGVEPLINTLFELLNTNDEDLIQMGINGRQLIEDQYSIDIVAKKTIELYKWVNLNGEKPTFVY